MDTRILSAVVLLLITAGEALGQHAQRTNSAALSTRRTRGVVIAVCLLVAGCGTAAPSTSRTGDDADFQPSAVPVQHVSTVAVEPQERPRDPLALLGKPIRDPAVEAFTGSGLRHCSINASAHLACPRLGVDIVFDGNDIIKQVILYPNAIGAYRPYTGALPLGLKASDTRAGVVAKLGKPDITQPNVDLYTSRSPSLSITYYPASSPQADLMRKLAVFRGR